MAYFYMPLNRNVSLKAYSRLKRDIFIDQLSEFSPDGLDKSSPILKRSEIEWSPDKGMKLLEIFQQISYPYRRHLKTLLIEGFGRELQYFGLALDAYIESRYKIPIDRIIFLASQGPIGSEILKKARKLLFKRKIEAIDFADQSEHPWTLDLIKDLTLDDIDNVFNYRWMPLWKEDVKDLEETFSIPVSVNQEILKSFKETLADLIKDIVIPDEDNTFDIMLSTSRSVSLEGKNKIYNFLRNQRSLDKEKNFSLSIGESVRTIIPVAPQGFRDAVIVDWKASNTIKFIEYRVRKILEHMPYQNYTDGHQSFYADVRKFYKYNNYAYVCRDIQKEGLTKPRILLKTMLEVLSQKDKRLEPFIHFYDDFSIKGYGVPNRGHGQGMANALTTLMQVVIIQMVNNSLAELGFNEVITAMNYNDDNVSRVPLDILDEFWDIEGNIMKGLSLIRSDSKSFHSKLGFVYCEMYVSPFFPNLNERQCTSRRNMLLTFLYDFPYEAKEYLKSQVGNSYFKDYLEEIVHTFGYEFFPEEQQYPLSIGGWMPDCVRGFSTALIDLENLPYDIRIPCMFEGSKILSAKTPLRRGTIRGKEKSNSIFDKIFPGYGPQIGKYLPTGKYSDLFFKYGLWREQVFYSFRTRKAIHEARRKKYLTKRHNYISLKDFIIENSKSGRFILPDWICSFSKEPISFFKEIRRDPYKQDTPLENYLKKIHALETGSSPFIEEYSIKEANFGFTLRKDELYFSHPEQDFEELEGIPMDPISFYSIDRFANNTAKFCLAHFEYYGRLPIVPEDFPENLEKKEVYKEFLSFEDYIEMSNLTYDRWNYSYLKKIEKIIENNDLSSDELNSIILEVKHQDDNASEISLESEMDEEERKRAREEVRRRYLHKKLDINSLQAILLGREDPDEYEHADILSFCVAPVLFFYNFHDSLYGDRHEKLRQSFEKFLSNDYLRELLVSCCEAGYLKDVGESLGIYHSSEDSLDDFCIDFNESDME